MLEKSADTLEVHSWIEKTAVEGPGLRFALWLQGCSIRCPGCANKHMWEAGKGKRIQVDDLLAPILEQTGIEGVTILGGEPLDQAEPLSKLLLKVKEAGLGTLVFTGYVFENILTCREYHQLRALDNTDLLIDGPFLTDRQTLDLPWVGSRNQRYIFLSERYSERDIWGKPNEMEVRICPEDGKLTFNGLAGGEAVVRLARRLRRKGIIEGE